MRFGLSIFQPELTRFAASRSRPTFAGPSNARAAVERAAYDEPLKDVDLLLMPTLPLKATLLPARDASREDYVARALEMIFNTCPFDVTGHPAATVPAGMSAGLLLA
jgi:Asp-tRNA(Asn)/Glu-tRNA(Gln) amidotransferase A subunit family amidase